MLSGDLGQGGRGCNYESQSDERPGVEVKDWTHVWVSKSKPVWEIVRVSVFRELGHNTGEDQ